MRPFRLFNGRFVGLEDGLRRGEMAFWCDDTHVAQVEAFPASLHRDDRRDVWSTGRKRDVFVVRLVRRSDGDEKSRKVAQQLSWLE